MRVVRNPNSRSARVLEPNLDLQGFGPGAAGKDVPGSLVDCPEAIAVGLSRKDAAAVDAVLMGLSHIDRLTEDQRNSVADLLFGFVLSKDFGELEVAEEEVPHVA